MCGILYGHRRDGHPVAKSLMKRYAHQKTRGQQGFGYLTIVNGKVGEVKRFESATEFEAALALETAPTILAHHRLPTSTPNYREATHPIVVSNKELDFDYYVIHNGVMRNEHELKPIHEKLGYEYTTEIEEVHYIRRKKGKKGKKQRETYSTMCFNDSEALAIEVARYLDGKSETIDFIGSAAVIVIKAQKDGTVVSLNYARNSGNPLIIEDNNALFYLKSEGGGTELLPDTLVSIDFETGTATRKPVVFGSLTKPYKSSDFDNRFGNDKDKDPYYDRRSIGFRDKSHDDDDFWDGLPFRRLIKSPLQQNERGDLLHYENDEEDQQELDIPVIAFDDQYEPDYEEAYNEYQKTEDYLIDLWDEIKALKLDIAACEAVLEGGDTSWTDMENRNYSPEYLEECNHYLERKEKEAAQLEQFLAGVM